VRPLPPEPPPQRAARTRRAARPACARAPPPRPPARSTRRTPRRAARPPPAPTGDSGGALVFNTGSPQDPLAGLPADDRVAGLASWAIGCGIQKLPAAYASAGAVSDWVSNALDAVRRALAAGRRRVLDGPRVRGTVPGGPAGTHASRLPLRPLVFAYTMGLPTPIVAPLPPPSLPICQAPSACGEAARPTCKAEADGRKERSWYGLPVATVQVDSAATFNTCCAECLARRAPGAGGCAAFSVALGEATGRRAPAPAARAGAACAACDADCHIYAGTPERLCRRRDRRADNNTCGAEPLGSGRVVY
jgi:hypothetical protein